MIAFFSGLALGSVVTWLGCQPQERRWSHVIAFPPRWSRVLLRVGRLGVVWFRKEVS